MSIIFLVVRYNLYAMHVMGLCPSFGIVDVYTVLIVYTIIFVFDGLYKNVAVHVLLTNGNFKIA